MCAGSLSCGASWYAASGAPTSCEYVPSAAAKEMFSKLQAYSEDEFHTGIGPLLQRMGDGTVRWADVKVALIRVLGADAVSAIESISQACQSFGHALKLSGVSMLTEQRPPFINLALIVNQLQSQGKYQVPPTSRIEFGRKDVLIKAARYVQFAKAAYVQSAMDIAADISGLGAEDVLYVHKSDDISCPNFFIADDRATNAIVLSIRGTKTPADVMTDLVCRTAPFLAGEAHAGMLGSADKVMVHAVPILRALIVKHPTRKIVVVGHSLGAGVAVLATLRLFSEAGTGFGAAMAGSSAFQCFAFAPPAVFGPPDKLPTFASSCIYSFVNHVDCIPRASALSIAALMQAVTYVDSLTLTPKQCIAFLTGMVPSSHSMEFPDEMPLETSTREHLMRSFGNLSGVGTMLLLYEDEGQHRCDEVNPDMIKKLLLHPDMVSAHSIVKYEKVVTEVASS